MTDPAGDRPTMQVGLSTASVYPATVAEAFELGAELGYDGIEVMVWTDPVSQDANELLALVDKFGLPVLAVHAPCLLITQRVWGAEPWQKLERSKDLAQRLGADIVVVHPPFRWQTRYARGFAAGLQALTRDSGVRFATENMYPLRLRGREVSMYAPSWDPVEAGLRDFTLDTSHTSVSGTDPLELLDRMGDGLAHVHIADGSGQATDEHLIPGRGDQPCGAVLERLAERGYSGSVVVEINTRKSPGRADRVHDLAQALAYTRLHLALPSPGPSWRPPPATGSIADPATGGTGNGAAGGAAEGWAVHPGRDTAG